MVEVDLGATPKVVRTDTGSFTADSVILATGSAYKELGLPREKELSGHGVSWCATCDGFFFRDQDVVVAGGGDSAMEEATFLTRFARKVYVVHRRDTLRASKVMQERAMADPKIEFVWNSEIEEILGDDRVSGVVVRNRVTGERSTLDVTGLFVAIGHDPRSELVKGQVDLDDQGYILVAHPTTQTRAFPVCSPPVTSSTTRTAKRSPRPAPDAPRRSMRSATLPTWPATTRPHRSPVASQSPSPRCEFGTSPVCVSAGGHKVASPRRSTNSTRALGPIRARV